MWVAKPLLRAARARRAPLSVNWTLPPGVPYEELTIAERDAVEKILMVAGEQVGVVVDG